MSRINLNIVATGDFSSVNRQLDQMRATVAQINARGAGVGISDRDIQSINRAVSSYDSLLHSTGAFGRQMVNVQDQTARFGRELETGKLKLGQYFSIWTRGSAQARQGLRDLAAQQLSLEQAVVRTDTTKVGKAYVDIPRIMQDAGRGTALARKEQQLYNLSLLKGGDAMINWGKNTQWAGRQLMVGLTVPMVMFGQKAAQSFKEFDQQMTRMIKVYGDGINSATNSQLETIRGQVTSLAQELAGRWGVAMKDTAATASDLAATGLTGIKLLKATEEATRLATLGELDRQDSIKATIALQTTFGLNSKELTKAVDFLNATENATSTSLQDLVGAIPRAGTVVKQLGGDYKELTAMMVSMREAGVSSGEAANAIKSALGALINPTAKIREQFQKFGIDLSQVRDKAGGDPVKMFASLGTELNKLDNISKARLIETLFGKYQFARISALIDNLGRKGSQTQKVFELMGQSATKMAQNSQQELDRMTNSPSMKFQRAVERMQAQLIPIGQKVLEFATKVMDAFGTVFKFLDDHPGLKNFVTNLAGLTALVGPVIMLAGVFGNFAGYLLKAFAVAKNFGNGFKGFGQLVTAESVAAAKAGDLFQQSLVTQSEAATILTDAVARLNAELAAYRGQAGGAAGVPPLPPPTGGGGRPPTGGSPMPPPPRGPVLLGGQPAPFTPAPLIIPGAMQYEPSQLLVPGATNAPSSVVVAPPAARQMPPGGPVRATMTAEEMASWNPNMAPKGGRTGTEIFHSTARSELIRQISKDIVTGSPLGIKMDLAQSGQGPLVDLLDRKKAKARDDRVRKQGGSNAVLPEDISNARRNIVDELVTRGAWSAKGLPVGGAGSEIQRAIQTVPQHFSLPSGATAADLGINMTPELEQKIMMSQIQDWSNQGGRPKKVEEILAGKGKVSLSNPEMQAWMGSNSRQAQAARAFTDSTMAEAERLLTTHQGQIDQNLAKLYNEATVAAGSGDWEATRTATTKLHEHLQGNFDSLNKSFAQRTAEIESHYDDAFKEAFNHPTNNNLDMEERIRRSAVSAQTKVDEMLDRQGLVVAEQFASNERQFDKVKASLGISTRYSRQGMGEVVTAAASRSIAAAEQLSSAQREVEVSAARSVSQTNSAIENAARQEQNAAGIISSTPHIPSGQLIVPGRPSGRGPGRIIVPGRAMGGAIYYGPGGNVSGPGGPTSDSIPAYLSNGEFVIRADSVNKIGVDNLRHMNEKGTMPGMAMGGLMSKIPHARVGIGPEALRKMWGQVNPKEKDIMRSIFGFSGNQLSRIIGERSHIFQLKSQSESGMIRNQFGHAGVAALVPREFNQILSQMYHLRTPSGQAILLRHGIDLKQYPHVERMLRERGQPGTYDEMVEMQSFFKALSGKPVLKRGENYYKYKSGRKFERRSEKFMESMLSGSKDDFIEKQLTLFKASELSHNRKLSEIEEEIAVMSDMLRSPNAEVQYSLFKKEQRDKYPVTNAAGFSTYGMARGGAVYGMGGPTSDSIPAHLSNGEYVVSAKGHQAAGTEFLDAINNGHFNMGGYAYAKGGHVKYKNGVRAFEFGDSVSAYKRTSLGVTAEGYQQQITHFQSEFDRASQEAGRVRAALEQLAREGTTSGAQFSKLNSALESEKKTVDDARKQIKLLERESQQFAEAEQRAAKAINRQAVILGQQNTQGQQAQGQQAQGQQAQGQQGGRRGRGGGTGDQGERRGRMGGMGMGMGLGMALSTAGGAAMMSDDKNVSSLGNVATMAGMGFMIHPAVGGVIAGLGLLKMGIDKYNDGIAANVNEMNQFAQRFSKLSVNEQGFLGVELKTYAEDKLQLLTGRTDEATSAVKQFAAAIKEAAVGTTEYARKQIFAQANTAQELFADPAFQKLFNSMQLELQGQGLSGKEQNDKLSGMLEGYLRGAGKDSLVPSVIEMATKRSAAPWEKNVIEDTKKSQKTIADFTSKTGVNLEGVKKYSEIANAFKNFTGGQELKAGKEGQGISSIGGLLSATNFEAGSFGSSDTLSLLVAQLLGEGQGGNQSINVGGQNLDLSKNGVDRKKAVALVDSILGPGWQDKYVATSGVSGTFSGGAVIKEKSSAGLLGPTVELSKVAAKNLNATSFNGNDIRDINFTNSLESTSQQMDMLRSSAKELFDQFALSNTGFMVEEFDKLIAAGGSSEQALLGIKDAIGTDQADLMNFNEGLAAANRIMTDASNATNVASGEINAHGTALKNVSEEVRNTNANAVPLTGQLSDVGIAAAAAALDLNGLGYQLSKMGRTEISIVINRVIRTREIQAANARALAPQKGSLEQAYAAYQESQKAPSDTSGGGSSGGSSGGGSGGGQFDSKPYDDAIKAQQKIIDGINKEREARQKLADTQKANDDFLKNEWALRKKIAEAQGQGDFLAADLAQRELNQLQDQKAKDDAEKAKRDAEDKRITAAETEIKRLQEALAEAQKASSGGSGGGSSGGGSGGGGGGGTAAPPKLPEGVTADTIMQTGSYLAAKLVTQGQMSIEEMMSNKDFKAQYNGAVLLMGKDAADTLFNTFISQAKTNIANAIPEVGKQMDLFKEALYGDAAYTRQTPEEQGTVNTLIESIIGDPATDIKTKTDRLTEALKGLNLNPATITAILSSWKNSGLQGVIQQAVKEIDTKGAAEVMRQKLEGVVPAGIDWKKLTPEQQQALGNIATEMALNGEVSVEAIKSLSAKMIPFNSRGSDQGQAFYDYGKGREVNEAQQNFSKTVTDMIGPASAAAATKSKAEPVKMSGTVATLSVPNGTVTYQDGSAPTWSGNGSYTDVNVQGKADGGYISGPGGPKDDLIPAMLSHGEYVVQADSVNHYGAGFLESINKKKFANGGIVNGGKINRMIDIMAGRSMGIPGFMEKDNKLKFANGGLVRGNPRVVPNQDFLTKVEPLAYEHQGTPYSSADMGTPAGWGCATSVYWLYQNGMGITLPSTGSSDELLHSSLPSVPVNGPYAPGDLILQYNPKGVNLSNDANHTEMILSNGMKWNGGVGIYPAAFNYEIKGVKRPVSAGYIFPQTDSKGSFNTTKNATYKMGTFHNGGAVGYSKGGEVMAMVQGGEVVVPIKTVDKVNPLLDAFTSGKMGLGGEITNNITINGANHSPKVIAEMVVGEIEKSMKRTVNVSRVR